MDSTGQPITLAVPEKLLRKLTRDAWFAAAGRARRSRAHTGWFDTDRFDLHRLGIRLSVIEAGGNSIQRVAMADGTEQLSAFRGGFNFWSIDPYKARRQLDKALRHGLSPVFETHCVVRNWELLPPECGPVRAKLIQGFQIQGGNQHPFCELHLAPSDPGGCGHFLVARRLIEALGLREEPAAAEERGFGLAQGRQNNPVTAGPSPVLPGQSCAQALCAIARDCTWQFRLNEAGANGSNDPEYVHQMRVALRRLRSGLRAFATLLPAGIQERFAPHLRAIGAALGTARDWDVTVEELILPLVRAHPGDARLARLAEEATLLRDAARARCTAALQEGAHRRVFADLLAYLHCEWQGEIEDPPPRLEDFAAQRLEWLHRKVEKAAKGASAEDVPTLHRLRITIKRLRYSLEFFAPLFPEADVRRYLNRMKSLQEDLGRLNDLANAYPRLAHCADENPSMAEGVAFAHGWYAQQLGTLLRRIPGEIGPLAKQRRFWLK